MTSVDLNPAVMESLKNRLLQEKNRVLIELRRAMEFSRSFSVDDKDNHAPVSTHQADCFTNGSADYTDRSVGRLQRQLAKIKSALKRVGEGSYGTCMECENPIPLDRLEVIPWTTLCVNCKEREEGSSNGGENGGAFNGFLPFVPQPSGMIHSER